MILSNIEFYNTPEGDVIYKPLGGSADVLREDNREMVGKIIAVIRDCYPKAFKCLMEIYSKSERNLRHYEFLAVSRFLRCNFGEYDQQSIDIDRNGVLRFEQVHCPMRGECKYEHVICNPELNSKLTEREKDVLMLMAEYKNQDEIAEELFISPCTVKKHRENIKAKLKARNIAEVVQFYNNNKNNL